jgi:hypothetical protein
MKVIGRTGSRGQVRRDPGAAQHAAPRTRPRGAGQAGLQTIILCATAWRLQGPPRRRLGGASLLVEQPRGPCGATVGR